MKLKRALETTWDSVGGFGTWCWFNVWIWLDLFGRSHWITVLIYYRFIYRFMLPFASWVRVFEGLASPWLLGSHCAGRPRIARASWPLEALLIHKVVDVAGESAQLFWSCHEFIRYPECLKIMTFMCRLMKMVQEPAKTFLAQQWTYPEASTPPSLGTLCGDLYGRAGRFSWDFGVTFVGCWDHFEPLKLGDVDGV